MFQLSLNRSLESSCNLGGGCDVTRVILELPGAWSQCSQQPDTTLPQPNIPLIANPDIVLLGYGDNIQSLNPQGCGVSGHQIQVPVTNLLNDTSNKSTDELTLALVNYRYGLFMQNISESNRNSSEQEQNLHHDLLCEGRNPADVIIEATKSQNQIINYTQPEFVLTTRVNTHHYVIVLDQTNRMEFNLRWRNIKRSLNRFIANLQTGTMISIVTCAAEGSLVLPPTVVTAANREGIHGRIPRRTEDVSVACISCGLRLAQDVLTGSAAGTVILLTGSNENDEINPVDLAGGRVFSILYPGLYSSPLGGAVYSIQEDTERSPVAQLNEVLLDIISKADNSRQLVKIHEASYQSFEFSGTFQLTDDQEDATVTLIVENEESVEYFEVMDPSNEKNIFPKYEDGSVQVHVAGGGQKKPGIWSYQAKLYADSSVAMHRMTVDVVAKYNNNNKNNHVRLSGLTMIPTPIDDLSAPVAILAKLYLGEAPVYSGSVTAFVTGPDTDSEIKLVDGSYPDVEGGDGVYTGYLTKFSTQPGYYTVRLAANDNNGLASVNKTGSGGQGPTGTFSRFVSATSFYISTGVPRGDDIIPPARIIDFIPAPIQQYNQTVTFDNNDTIDVDNLFDNETITVSLQFTSPGDDYMSGQVQSYEIRCHTNREALSTHNFPSDGLVIPLANKPAPAGNLEVVQVPVPWIGETWYYGIVGIDNAGNRGKISNLAAVFIALPEQPDYDGESGLGCGDMHLKLSTPSWFLDTEYMYIIGGCVAGAILCVVLIVMFIMHKSRKAGSRSKTGYMQDDDTYESGFQPTESGSPKSQGIIKGQGDKAETESGIYSWLESLPRSEASGKGVSHLQSPGQMPAMGCNAAVISRSVAAANGILMAGPKRGVGNMNCGDEGSNNSRPTTSTDDSISDSGDGEISTGVSGSQQTVGSGIEAVNGGHPNTQVVWEDNVSQDDYASQVLARSFQYYNSASRPRGQNVYPQQQIPAPPATVVINNIPNHSPVPVHHNNQHYHQQQNHFVPESNQFGGVGHSGSYNDASRASFYRKKRHESVV